MLAVFSKSAAKFPTEMIKLLGAQMGDEAKEELPSEKSVEAMKNLERTFVTYYPNASVIRRLPQCIFACVLDQDSIITQRCFSATYDIYCIFRGKFSNIDDLRKEYGLSTDSNESNLVIKAFRKHYPEAEKKTDADTKWCKSVEKDFKGEFAFMVFDARNNTFFATGDFDLGSDCEENVIFFSACGLLENHCVKFYGTIPEGFFVATSKGVRKFDDPSVFRKLPLASTEV